MILKSKLCLPVLIATAISMTSCTSTKNVPTTSDTEAFASKVIAEKVSVAADAQQRYVALVAEDKSLQGKKQASLDTDQVNVDYIGKPQELIQTFAYRYGYRYIEEGRPNDLRIVNVRVSNWAPIEVLRNVGRQIDNGADLELDKNAKVIRLVYKSLPISK